MDGLDRIADIFTSVETKKSITRDEGVVGAIYNRGRRGEGFSALTLKNTKELTQVSSLFNSDIRLHWSMCSVVFLFRQYLSRAHSTSVPLAAYQFAMFVFFDRDSYQTRTSGYSSCRGGGKKECLHENKGEKKRVLSDQLGFANGGKRGNFVQALVESNVCVRKFGANKEKRVARALTVILAKLAF